VCASTAQLSVITQIVSPTLPCICAPVCMLSIKYITYISVTREREYVCVDVREDVGQDVTMQSVLGPCGSNGIAASL
jgi:hypothetical protein